MEYVRKAQDIGQPQSDNMANMAQGWKPLKQLQIDKLKSLHKKKLSDVGYFCLVVPGAGCVPFLFGGAGCLYIYHSQSPFPIFF